MPHAHRIYRLVLVSLLVALLCPSLHVVGDEPPYRVYLPLNMRTLAVRGAYNIAFVSDRDGNDEIYVMDENGAFVANVSNHPAADNDPDWSPDGSKLAFVSDRDGNDEIYVTNADGSGLVNLTNDPGRDWDPVWSPDGTRIAFLSDRDDAWKDIWVIGADGTGLDWLTDGWDVHWSPDGEKLTYVAFGESRPDIFVIDADGSDETRVTSTDGREEMDPRWSPDGERIAYSLDSMIFNLDPDDDTDIWLLTPGADYSYWPRWSPDGCFIAFNSSGIYDAVDHLSGGPSSIWVVEPWGHNPVPIGQQLTTGPACWLGDFERLVYPSWEENGQRDIRIVSLDGTVRRNLTSNPAWDRSPACSIRAQ